MNRYLEVFWWAITILILIIVTFLGITDGFDKWLYYYIMVILSVAMALMRRFMRKRLEKSMQVKNKKGKK